MIGEYHNDEDPGTTLSLVRPDDVECEERFVFFRLRSDGIVCSANSLKGNSYDCLSLECINCNEWDRQKNLMTIHGLLLNKGNTTESAERCHRYIQEYLKFVKYTGLNGLYVKDKKWVHYRWAIANIVCDTVAQEELNGLLGKKLSPYPCLFDRECKAQRFCPESYSFTDICSPASLSGKTGLHVIGQPLNHLHPKSFYRCPSLVYHLNGNVGLLFGKHNLSEDQRNEALTLNTFFQQFPETSFHQWTPNTISPAANQLYLQKELTETVNSDMSEEEECSDHSCQDDNESVTSSDSFIENEFVEDDECHDSDDERLNVTNDDDDAQDGDYDVERSSLHDNSVDCSFGIQNRMSNEDNDSFYYCYTDCNIDEEELKKAFPNSSSSELKKIKRFLASRDERMIPSSHIRLDECIIPREGEREIVDSQHNMANIAYMFIRILNNELPSPIAKRNVGIILDKTVRQAIFNDDMDVYSSYTLYPDFSDIVQKAKQRIRQLKLPSELNWIKEDILETKHFKALSNYRDILFLFSFYHVIFQDSMYHPVIFLFKLIFDDLDYFYNFYGDLDDLAKHQANFNVYSGLLQGELAPGYLTYSLHNAIHYYQSVVCGGEVSLNACFISEHFYSIPKMNVCKGMNPELAAGKRQHYYHTSLLIANIADQYSDYPITKRKYSREYVIYGRNVISLFNDDFLTLFLRFTKLNICDDIKYELDPSIPHVTFLDTVLNRRSHLSESNLELLISSYMTYETTGSYDKIIIQKKSPSLYSSLVGGNYCVDLPGKIEEYPYKYQRLATTRSLDGTQHLFIVVGFISVPLNNDNLYHQALCIKVNTTSSSSFSQTLHSGFIERNEFERCLKDLQIIPISIKRLVFRSVVVYEHKDHYSYSIFKLNLHQWKAENHGIADYLSPKMITRSNTNKK